MKARNEKIPEKCVIPSIDLTPLTFYSDLLVANATLNQVFIWDVSSYLSFRLGLVVKEIQKNSEKFSQDSVLLIFE